FQATGRPLFERTAREIVRYVTRDMTSPEGAFLTAEDADSEGVEGRFYLWTWDEAREILGDDIGLAEKVFGIRREGNWQGPQEGGAGANVLHLRRPIEILARDLEKDGIELERDVEDIRRRLFEARSRRVRPGLDDKVLADWNGLMIAALAKASRALGEPEYASAAARAADHVLGRMTTGEGRLLHRYRTGMAGIPGALDDHAFMAWGLVELYQATFDARHLEASMGLTSHMIERFWDDDGGGFFSTADDAEVVLFRRKEAHDGAIPSGNSVAMTVLLLLARLTGDAGLEETASRLADAFAGTVGSHPANHANMMSALEMARAPSMEVVLVGSLGDPSLEAMRAEVDRRFLPGVVLLHRDPDAPDDIDRLTGFTADLGLVDGRVAAYVCRGRACARRVTDASALAALLPNGMRGLRQVNNIGRSMR
ncbi:MAG: thioredoxin domain-containing protein, partial [Thermoplasmata archaeon]|nr:thioredoxin domain-containing protein [Thermoplasmata archaeon]